MSNQDLSHIEQLLKDGKYPEAERVANRLKTDGATKLAVLASIALKSGDRQRAEVLFQQALALNQQHGLALVNYTKLLIGQRKFRQALPLAEQGFKQSPKEESVALCYVQCLAETDRFNDATKVLAAHLAKDKPSIAVLVAQVSVLRADLRAKEALEVLERALSLYPDNPELERAQADVYAEMDPSSALEYFRKLSEKNNTIQATWNRSFVELRLQLFDEGWEHYEAGLEEKIGKIGRPLPAQVLGVPRVTDISALDPQKWTVFVAEQGLGDQVLFLGALRQALAEVNKPAYIGEERMLPIIRRSVPDLPVYPYAMGLNLAKQTHRVNGLFPIGSLQKTYRRSKDAFKQTQFPYLLPNPDLVTRYRERLTQKAEGRPLIGLSWRGGFWDRQKRTKSFELEYFAPLMRALNATFISLQYGDVAAERDYRKEHNLPLTFIEGIDFKKDIDGWFALACACDHIVSVSTALVHFAGAAGKTVDLLIGDGQAPFIWGTGEGQSLAYPSIQIHRKQGHESTEAFFQRTAEYLTCRFTQR